MQEISENVEENDKQVESMQEASENVLEKHPELFKRYSLGYFNPNPDNRVGINIFNNSTRCQIKNIE